MRTGADVVLFVLLLAFLMWVPMPFGSASDASQLPLIVPPLIICAAAALLRAMRKEPPFVLTRPGLIWTAGASLFVLAIAVQLVPMPLGLLRLVSPSSEAIWQRAAHLASLSGVAVSTLHPITVDPTATALQLFRVLAFFATFLASMLLVRDMFRRTVMASVLAALGLFEALYAVNATAQGSYAIWGWKNVLIFGRATGTFVNPNHFAHYAAILLPMGLYVSACAWHTAAPAGALLSRRFVKLVERRLFPFSYGLLAALACVAAVLVSESRGAVLAIVGGFAIVGAIASPDRSSVLRAGLIAIGASTTIVAVVLLLGRSETVSRIEQSKASQLNARRASAVGALRIWEMFPVFGSGAGTYQDAVLMTRATSIEVLANHAHDDYLEILATTGTLGFVIALVSLFGGFAALAKNAFGGMDGEPMSWRRRAFKTAALASLAIAMIHAFIDFNFFIPANPITLAAIAGAAVVAKES